MIGVLKQFNVDLVPTVNKPCHDQIIRTKYPSYGIQYLIGQDKIGQSFSHFRKFW